MNKCRIVCRIETTTHIDGKLLQSDIFTFDVYQCTTIIAFPSNPQAVISPRQTDSAVGQGLKKKIWTHNINTLYKMRYSKHFLQTTVQLDHNLYTKCELICSTKTNYKVIICKYLLTFSHCLWNVTKYFRSTTDRKLPQLALRKRNANTGGAFTPFNILLPMCVIWRLRKLYWSDSI